MVAAACQLSQSTAEVPPGLGHSLAFEIAAPNVFVDLV
jgi:hypothetical protein